eukprot:g3530.t1
MGDNPVHTADSKSLWNYTLSPGWTDKEIEVFVAAIQKYGVGRWTKITKERILPGKTVAQMYNQCQRLLGQQSLAEFEGLKLNLKSIFEKNAKIQGENIVRKNNCIVNQGDKQTREMIIKKKAYNKEHFGLTDEEVAAIVIPELKHEDTSSVFVNSASTGRNSNPGQIRLEKIQRLKMLQKELSLIETQIAKQEKLEADPNYKKKQVKKLSFRKVGEKVKADCDWDEYYSGIITAVNNDGTVNITFEDGEKVKNVRESQIKGHRKNSGSSSNTSAKAPGTKRKTSIADKQTNDSSNSPFEKTKRKKRKSRSSRKASNKTDEEKSIELALKLSMQDDY